ncbi:hypothetical protein ACRAWC_18160 [Leifsonia sp. L25]|uniref:hypothetical protein n=1 Tax=Actinomycetes TaxID=1760 RepID=UPI003D69F46F
MSVVEFSADSWQASSPGLQEGLAHRVEVLSELVKGLEALAASNQISGVGADAMRAYIREVQVPVARSLLVGVSTFQTAIGVYWAGYAQVDTDGDFRLVADEFDAHLTQLDTGLGRLRGFETELTRISAGAGHLVSLGGAGARAAGAAVEDFEGMRAIARMQKETWEAYEASDPGFNQVRELIAELKGVLKNLGSLTVGRGRSYTAGSFDLTLARLGELTTGMFEYCQANQQVASEGWKDMFDKYAQDVDAARREQALTDLIWDGLQILTGAVVTAIGLGLTPFTAGFSLGLTAIGGTLLVGGINSAINHVSIAATGNELDLAGMAGQWWDASVARPVADWGGDWQYVGGFLSGAGHAVTGMAQLNVQQIGVGITALATDQAARDALWQQVSGFVGRIASGDKFAVGQVVGEVAGLIIPGAAAAKLAREGGPVAKMGGMADGLVKPAKLPHLSSPDSPHRRQGPSARFKL